MKHYYLLHHKVTQKFKLYQKWHEHPYHLHLHWLAVVNAFFVALIIILFQIEITFEPMEFRVNVPKVTAQTISERIVPQNADSGYMANTPYNLSAHCPLSRYFYGGKLDSQLVKNWVSDFASFMQGTDFGGDGANYIAYTYSSALVAMDIYEYIIAKELGLVDADKKQIIQNRLADIIPKGIEDIKNGFGYLDSNGQQNAPSSYLMAAAAAIQDTHPSVAETAWQFIESSEGSLAMIYPGPKRFVTTKDGKLLNPNMWKEWYGWIDEPCNYNYLYVIGPLVYGIFRDPSTLTSDSAWNHAYYWADMTTPQTYYSIIGDDAVYWYTDIPIFMEIGAKYFRDKKLRWIATQMRDNITSHIERTSINYRPHLTYLISDTSVGTEIPDARSGYWESPANRPQVAIFRDSWNKDAFYSAMALGVFNHGHPGQVNAILNLFHKGHIWLIGQIRDDYDIQNTNMVYSNYGVSSTDSPNYFLDFNNRTISSTGYNVSVTGGNYGNNRVIVMSRDKHFIVFDNVISPDRWGHSIWWHLKGSAKSLGNPIVAHQDAHPNQSLFPNQSADMSYYYIRGQVTTDTSRNLEDYFSTYGEGFSADEFMYSNPASVIDIKQKIDINTNPTQAAIFWPGDNPGSVTEVSVKKSGVDQYPKALGIKLVGGGINSYAGTTFNNSLGSLEYDGGTFTADAKAFYYDNNSLTLIAAKSFNSPKFQISSTKEIPGMELRYNSGNLVGEVSYPLGQSITIQIGLDSAPNSVIINGQDLGSKPQSFSITVNGTRKDAYVNRLYKPYNEYYANSFGSLPPPDTIPPTINYFRIDDPDNPPSLPITNTDGTPDIFWDVEDTPAGSHLARVEIWRTQDPNNWGNTPLQTIPILGDLDSHTDSWSGSVSNGTYWYGLHVIDKVGLETLEPNPPGPLEVRVNITAGPMCDVTTQTNISERFQAQTTDPDGDQLYYTFNWGDGATSRQPGTGYVDSGTLRYADHSWSSQGEYDVSVTATDSTGLTSESSDSLKVCVIGGTSFAGIDLNCDNIIDIKEFGILLSWWGRTGSEIENYQNIYCPPGALKSLDLDASGQVDAGDIAIIFSNWGITQ